VSATPADRIQHARELLTAAEDELRLAGLTLKASRPELVAEIAVLERSRDRLAVVRARVLGLAWRKLVALAKPPADPGGTP
jgi:hypothetical protein